MDTIEGPRAPEEVDDQQRGEVDPRGNFRQQRDRVAIREQTYSAKSQRSGSPG